MSNTIKIYGLIMLLVFGFTACDDEPLPEDLEFSNDPPSAGVDVEENELVGEWLMTDHTFSISQEGNATSGEETLPVSRATLGDYVEGDLSIIFQENGEYTTSGTTTYNITVTQDGSPSEPEEFQDSLVPNSGTWPINNGLLILVGNNEETQSIITSFDAQEMIITQNQALPGFGDLLNLDGYDFGDAPGFQDPSEITFDVENTFDSEMTFTKQE